MRIPCQKKQNEARLINRLAVSRNRGKVRKDTMKRIIALTAVLMLAFCIVGCKTATAPLPAWAPNSQVATVAQFIDAANKDVFGYEQDQADCLVTPTLVKCPGVSDPAIHAAVVGLRKALTIAQPQFTLWEKAVAANPGATEPADLTAAISTIQSTLTQYPQLAK